MPNDELGNILKMPVPCPHCLQESAQTVAFLINNEEFTCPDCNGAVDLTTKEWRAFKEKFAEALNAVQPYYAQLPQ
jgi:transcription initiation factor IIE alpha subunit